jgi:hypothetical protein
MFLNCNYPYECKIPKGKPKNLKNIKLEIKKGKHKLLIAPMGDIYFVDDGYYFGIELSKFLVKNLFGVNVFETIGKINIALLDWGYGRNKFAALSTEQQDLLQTYLLTLR